TESVGTHDRYLRYVLEHLGVTAAATVAAMERWRRGYNAPTGLRILAAAPARAHAKAAGLIVGVISNSNGTVSRTLECAGLGVWIDFVVDSSVVGVEKPDPRIFSMAVERAGVSPGEAAYVGDL